MHSQGKNVKKFLSSLQSFIPFKLFESTSITCFCKSVLSHLFLILRSSFKPTVATSILPTETQHLAL